VHLDVMPLAQFFGQPLLKPVFEHMSRGLVIARTENDKILFDPRTVLRDELLLSTLKSLLMEKL